MGTEQPVIGPKCHEPAWKRFFKAFCLAGIVYLSFVLLTERISGLAAKHLLKGVPAGPLEEDGHLINCAALDSHVTNQPSLEFPPYSSKASFAIPTSTSLAFLLSRGSYGRGTISFELSDKSGDEIDVEVVLSYYTFEARDSVRICNLERDGGGQGIGFYTPQRTFPGSGMRDHVSFDIKVRFPRSGSANHPLVINAFETHMGIWSHYIASLEDLVVFKSMSLKASNSLIRSHAVSVESADFKTSNAPITGSFNVSDSLTLSTSNSPITADFRLENRDGQKATRLEMKTSNGRIETPITLISTHQSSSSPNAFTVTAQTSNSALTLTFPDAPSSPFSLLTLSARTSNSPANIKLHPTYEGSISLQTSLFTPKVLWEHSQQDPSGKGRKRNVKIRRIVRGSLEAGTWWGDDSNKEEGKGSVVVRTSNAQNSVRLD